MTVLPGRPEPPGGQRGFATYSPFRLGLTASIGFGIAYLLFRALERGADTLILIGLSLFLAAGLDPAVRRVQLLGLNRGLSVAVVFVVTLLFITGIGFAVVPPLVDQSATFAHNLPNYVTELQNNHRVAELDRRFGILKSVQNYLHDSQLIKQLAGNLLSVGTTLATTIFSIFSLSVMTLYFLTYLRDITGFAYRISPASRRQQVSSIGDKIVYQIGRYVAGTTALAIIKGVATLLFLWIVGVPYPIALAFLVAVLDTLPLVGSVLAAAVVSTVVLLESVPTGIAVICFFVGYEVLNRVVLMRRLLDESVRISPAAAVVGALAGYAMLGVLGFLVSIPLVAVLTLILREVVVPRQQAR
ncbi:MAG TPA: AI-2E family transporter [Jatrophihabitans sp.]